MNKKTFTTIISLILLSSPALFGFGEGYEGTRSGQALNLASTPSGAALGGAFASSGEGISGVYYNPASLSGLSMTEVEASYAEIHDGVVFNSLLAARNFSFGSIGLGYTGTSLGGLERRSGDTAGHDGKFGASDSVFSVFFAPCPIGSLKTGIALKYLYSEIDDRTAAAVAMDIGLQYRMGDLTAGLAARNIGTRLKYISEEEKLPLDFAGGLTYRFGFPGKISFEALLPTDSSALLMSGLEYVLSYGEIKIPLRAGFRYSTSNTRKDTLTAGGGLELGNYIFGFAWVPNQDIGPSFLFSLKGSF